MFTVKDKFSRRRVPKTSRSQATVESILQATSKLLEKNGFYSITTNHIAEHAGVNIGSLYQYFSTRESVALALYENTSARVANSFRHELLTWGAVELQKSAPKLIGMLLSIYKANSTVLLRLPDLIPELKERSESLDIANLVRSAGHHFVGQYCPELSIPKQERVYYIISTSVLGCIRSYILHPPGNISERVFVQELARSTIASVTALRSLS